MGTPAKVSLYELTAQARPLMEIEELDAQTIEDTLEGMGYQDKVAACIAAYKGIAATADIYETEIKRLTAIKKSHENKANGLKEYVRGSMEALGLKEAGTEFHKAKLMAGRASVVITDEALVPAEFKKIEVSISKMDIAKALKEGGSVSGAEMAIGKPALKII